MYYLSTFDHELLEALLSVSFRIFFASAIIDSCFHGYVPEGKIREVVYGLMTPRSSVL